jgi:hypothetical protein
MCLLADPDSATYSIDPVSVAVREEVAEHNNALKLALHLQGQPTKVLRGSHLRDKCAHELVYVVDVR